MDANYMSYAIDLSKKGIGYTNPNPLVGAVIVKNGQIIGQGYHERYGAPHAEINAFRSTTENTAGSTMYVTMEPCSHIGKTPPCAEAIIQRKISKVVIGMIDPNPLVSGKGIQILKDHGIEVVTGVLSEEIEKINEIFIKFITTALPFCIMKTAMTLDGKIATVIGESKWITGDISRKAVHNIRHQVSGIMVGIGTILSDDPSLTTRLETTTGIDAHRIIVDTHGVIPLTSKVLTANSMAKTMIATTEKADHSKLTKLRDLGAEIVITPLKNEKVDLVYLMKELGRMKIDSVLLEGGSELNFSAIEQKIVDKVLAFIAPKLIGGRSSKTPIGGQGFSTLSEAVSLHNISVEGMGQDIKIEGYVRR